ncbi:hypothetical protein YC2023_069245 [Brassica napus]
MFYEGMLTRQREREVAVSLSFCFDHQSTVLMSLLCVCFCSYTSSNKALSSIEEVDPHIQLVGWMTPLHQEKSGETKRKIYTYYKPRIDIGLFVLLLWSFDLVLADESSILSPLLTKKQAHRRFRRGGVELLFIEEKVGAMKMQVEAKHKKRVQARFLSLKAVAFKMVFVYIDSGFDILIILPCRTRRGVLIAVKSQKRGIPS